MKKANLKYFENEDIIHINIADGPEADSVEISPFITAELDESGELIGIEICRASDYLRNVVMEGVQAKLALAHHQE